MSKKIINITAATMALAVTLSGCATAVVQERKDQAAAAAVPKQHRLPSQQRRNRQQNRPRNPSMPGLCCRISRISRPARWTILTLPGRTVFRWGRVLCLTMTAASSIRCAALIPARHWISRTLHYRMYGICL